MRLLGNIILALLFCGLGAGLGKAQVRKNDLAHEGFKGRVKTVKTERARMVKESGKWIEKDKKVIDADSYDIEGRIAQSTIYVRNGPPSVTTFSYEKDGTRLGTPNVNSQLAQVLGVSAPDLDYSMRTKCSFSYDARGNRAQDSCRGTTSSFVIEHRFEYNDKDRPTIDAYYRQGVLVLKKTYTYDEKGNVTTMSHYDAKGKLVDREYYSYEFDATGNWVKRRTSKFFRSSDTYNYEPFEVNYRTISYY